MNRIAVVTGANRGLGYGIASRLVADGWSVALIDTDSEVVETASRLSGTTGEAIGLVADVTDPQACAAVAHHVESALGPIGALVNNAGIGGSSDLVHESDPAEFRRVIDINLLGPFNMAQAVVPRMIASKAGGALVNITSILAQQAEVGSGAYSASKGGLALLSQTMAVELAPHGIRVNSVAPGNMLTAMHVDHVQDLADRANITYDDALAQVRDTVPLGRHGLPDDIGNVVAWLLSPDASYVTGQTISVNGGVYLT